MESKKYNNVIYFYGNDGKPLLFHTSPPVFRNKILKNGLKIGVGESYSMHYDFKEDLTPYIFLSNEPYDSTYDDDVWIVDISGLNLKPDPDTKMEGCYVSSVNIPKNKIALIYKGHDNEDPPIDLIDKIKNNIKKYLKKHNINENSILVSLDEDEMKLYKKFINSI